MNKIEWNPRKLAALRRAIKQARSNGVDEFVFEGYELFVPYAEYIANWIEGQLKK